MSYFAVNWDILIAVFKYFLLLLVFIIIGYILWRRKAYNVNFIILNPFEKGPDFYFCKGRRFDRLNQNMYKLTKPLAREEVFLTTHAQEGKYRLVFPRFPFGLKVWTGYCLTRLGKNEYVASKISREELQFKTIPNDVKAIAAQNVEKIMKRYKNPNIIPLIAQWGGIALLGLALMMSVYFIWQEAPAVMGQKLQSDKMQIELMEKMGDNIEKLAVLQEQKGFIEVDK